MVLLVLDSSSTCSDIEATAVQLTERVVSIVLRINSRPFDETQSKRKQSEPLDRLSTIEETVEDVVL